jgi:predicted dehydrogenase
LIKYKAAVIGLGKIGLGYDYDYEKNNFSITHSSAFNNHPSYELVGSVDSDKNKRILFEKKYKINTYASIDDLIKNTDLDILAISVPTDLHYKIFMKAINYNIKAILCEKPFSNNLFDAKKMTNAATKTKIIVNYIRRFNKATIKLKKEINNGIIGAINSGKIWYSNGLLNNGSHFIDLMIYFFGYPTNIKILNKSRSNFYEPDFKLEFGKINISYLCTRTHGYNFMELDLMGSDGRIRYTNNNIYYYKVKNHIIYNKVNILSLVEKKDLRLDNYQFEVLEKIKNKEHTFNDVISNGESALLTLNVINEIKTKLKNA